MKYHRHKQTREQRIIEQMAVGAVIIIAAFIVMAIYEWV